MTLKLLNLDTLVSFEDFYVFNYKPPQLPPQSGQYDIDEIVSNFNPTIGNLVDRLLNIYERFFEDRSYNKYEVGKVKQHIEDLLSENFVPFMKELYEELLYRTAGKIDIFQGENMEVINLYASPGTKKSVRIKFEKLVTESMTVNLVIKDSPEGDVVYSSSTPVPIGGTSVKILFDLSQLEPEKTYIYSLYIEDSEGKKKIFAYGNLIITENLEEYNGELYFI